MFTLKWYRGFALWREGVEGGIKFLDSLRSVSDDRENGLDTRENTAHR